MIKIKNTIYFVAVVVLFVLTIQTYNLNNTTLNLANKVKAVLSNNKNQEEKTFRMLKSINTQELKDKINSLEKTNKINIQNNQGFNFLTQCIKHNNNEMANFLITSTSINLNKQTKDGDTALHWSVRNGNEEITRNLIFNRARLDIKNKLGNTPLHVAAQEGNLEILKLLVEGETSNNTKKTQLNELNNQGYIPFTLAVKNNHPKIIEYMFKLNPMVLSTTNPKNNYTPLLIAAENGYDDVVKAFLDKDSDIVEVNVNATSNSGFTSLMLAAQNGHNNVIINLLRKGANINAASNLGFTSLMLATQNGHLDTVKILLENNANINLENKKGNTAISIASENKQNKIASILRELILIESKIDMPNSDLNKIFNDINNPEIKIILIKRLINQSKLKTYPVLIEKIKQLSNSEQRQVFDYIVVSKLLHDIQIPKISKTDKKEISNMLNLSLKHAPQSLKKAYSNLPNGKIY